MLFRVRSDCCGRDNVRKRLKEPAFARIHPARKRRLAWTWFKGLLAGISVLSGCLWANHLAAVSKSETARRHWAFQRLAPVGIPALKNPSRAHTVIDRFILAKLEEHGLEPAAAADKRTLIRRVSYDLSGLPPVPAEVEELVNDPAPDALDKFVERRLRSPQFGECWGRHWLDWAGYVDVLGGDNDAGIVKLGEGKWRYRDYVIGCLNEDRPFDRFIREQLAGDEMVDWRNAEKFNSDLIELLTATTFLRSAVDDTDENELNTPDVRHGVLQRTAEVVANSLLGLTLNCAKCHDHKYDPISQAEYYRFTAYFTPAFNPERWLQPKDRALADVANKPKEAIERHNKTIEEAVQALTARREQIEAPMRTRLLDGKLAALPEEIRADARAAIQTAADKRTEVQKYLANKFEKSLTPKPEEIRAALGEQNNATVAFFEQEIARLNGTRKNWGTIQAVYDVGSPPATHVLQRGNYLAPGQEVQPGFLSALCEISDTNSPASAKPGATREPCGSTSGRRLALAHWLTDTNSPAADLLARVIMNRVWQELFGAGIVETSDNFGLAGARPTHPELLDWLAEEFQRQGWRLKPMLKLIMTSATYRQSSATPQTPGAARAMKIDPANQLLWRQRLRRLDSEKIRDALLAVGGKLDRAMGGPPVALENRPDGLVVVREKDALTPTSKWRRSIYLLARRNYQLSLLSTFDQPMMALNCTRRTPSAVVLQSLTMLNDAFVLEQAGFLAARIAEEKPGVEDQQIQRAFALALSRKPDAEELGWCRDFIARQTERHQSGSSAAPEAGQQALMNLCHMLMNSSEFLYVR
jgi:hypothetical protein